MFWGNMFPTESYRIAVPIMTPQLPVVDSDLAFNIGQQSSLPPQIVALARGGI